jgi:hypothetical protein
VIPTSVPIRTLLRERANYWSSQSLIDPGAIPAGGVRKVTTAGTNQRGMSPLQEQRPFKAIKTENDRHYRFLLSHVEFLALNTV